MKVLMRKNAKELKSPITTGTFSTLLRVNPGFDHHFRGSGTGLHIHLFIQIFKELARVRDGFTGSGVIIQNIFRHRVPIIFWRSAPLRSAQLRLVRLAPRRLFCRPRWLGHRRRDWPFGRNQSRGRTKRIDAAKVARMEIYPPLCGRPNLLTLDRVVQDNLSHSRHSEAGFTETRHTETPDPKPAPKRGQEGDQRWLALLRKQLCGGAYAACQQVLLQLGHAGVPGLPEFVVPLGAQVADIMLDVEDHVLQ
jgi:hypothetical protein